MRNDLPEAAKLFITAQWDACMIILKWKSCIRVKRSFNMILKRIPGGMLESNCYMLGENGEGAVIDAGVGSENIVKAAAEAALKIKYIILTHSHIDHICSVDGIKDKTGAKVLVHDADAAALLDNALNLASFFGNRKPFRGPDETLKDGDALDVGGLKLEILHTPGHSAGSICIKAGNIVFTGDTLFKMSIGRTDLGNGSYSDIINSIKNKLMTLDDNVVVYPGHGDSTTIGYERIHNPYV